MIILLIKCFEQRQSRRRQDPLKGTLLIEIDSKPSQSTTDGSQKARYKDEIASPKFGVNKYIIYLY
jgi:hypothetical protein